MANPRHETCRRPVDLGEVMAFLRRRLPPDAMQTSGAGNFTVWAHRFAEFRRFGTQASPTQRVDGLRRRGGDRGEARAPGRIALCFTGDGDFVMSSRVCDRGPVRPADRRAAREQRHVRDDPDAPGAPVPGARDRHDRKPRLAALAQAYGGHGERVERTQDFEAAFERALASGKPALLELRSTRRGSAPRQAEQLRASVG